MWNREIVHVVAISFCWLAGCAGGGSAGLLGLLGASEEDLQAIADAQGAFNDRVDALPSVHVRIINETATIANVSVYSFAKGPEFPSSGGLLSDFSEFNSGTDLVQIVGNSVIVAQDGMVEGRIKCADLLVVSVWAPIDLNGFGSLDESIGLYGYAGNINLTGAGTSSVDEFSGDTIATARYIDPVTDGLNCEHGTLVIRIHTPSTDSVADPQTSQIITGQTPGTGSLSIE